jgi:hypothetical protein
MFKQTFLPSDDNRDRKNSEFSIRPMTSLLQVYQSQESDHIRKSLTHEAVPLYHMNTNIEDGGSSQKKSVSRYRSDHNNQTSNRISTAGGDLKAGQPSNLDLLLLNNDEPYSHFLHSPKPQHEPLVVQTID